MNECPLTWREIEIIALLAGGLAWKVVGRQLGLSSGQVEWIVREAKRKTGSKTVVELVATALRKGWIT